MREWIPHFKQDKIKGWMQDFLFNEKLYTEITRTTMLMCINVREADELGDRLEEVFGLIYILMTQTGREINVTDALRYVEESVRYEDNEAGVYYQTGAAKTEKQQKESREWAALGEPDDTFMGSEFLQLHPVIDSRNLLTRLQSL